MPIFDCWDPDPLLCTQNIHTARQSGEEKIMRIGILTTHLTEDEKRLQEVGKQKGHEVIPLEVLKCSISICPDNARVYYEGKCIGKYFDAIIPRIDPPHTDFGLTVLRQFQAVDVYTTDTAYSLELCRDKKRSLQYMIRKNVPFPVTGYAHSKKNLSAVIDAVGGTPVVIKLNEGTEGVGVFLADSSKQVKNFLTTFRGMNARIMIQEFISESAGEDIRCMVIGGEIVGAYVRKSQDGDFRANLALGASLKKADLSNEEKEIALRAAKALDLNMAGVDLIRSNRGSLVIEVNSAMDFADYGIEKISEADIAGAMIDFAVAGKKAFDKDKGGWLKEAA